MFEKIKKNWGFSTHISKVNNVDIFLIEVEKNGYCSKHRHFAKYNQFYVINGLLEITINFKKEDKIFLVGDNQRYRRVDVYPANWHRFLAKEKTLALEIYWGKNLLDDIERQDEGGIKDE